MSMLKHRLQILIDPQRYERLQAHARERGVSIARVVRDAIDQAVPRPESRRALVGRRILAAPPMPVPDPDELKAELDEIRGGAR